MAWNVPAVFVALNTLTAAQLNQFRDSLKAIGDPWTSYTPTTTNVTLGNGTIAGAYLSAGQLVHFRIKLTLGSTSALTGSPTFTLPVTAVDARWVNAVALMFDSSATGYKVGAAFNSGAGTVLVRDDASAALSATSPFTWATSDELVITGSYEAA